MLVRKLFCTYAFKALKLCVILFQTIPFLVLKNSLIIHKRFVQSDAPHWSRGKHIISHKVRLKLKARGGI